jgi:tetratricopeptide (TPR) repeat protein
MFPVSSLPKDKQNTGGPFDKAIEKGVKAIKTHSIQTKPERQTGKKNDSKYQEWINRTEYNSFLHNAWMLIAQSQFHNGDFLQAASSFSYISRLYHTQPEILHAAKIQQARCYAEIGWFYEAEDILSKIKKDGLSKKLQNQYSTVYADLLIKEKQYQEAIPYLQTAIKAEKNKWQKNREKYLLGQIYSHLGEKKSAYKIFEEVASSSVAYPLTFSAKIRQTEVYAGGDTSRIVGDLRKMIKSTKNKDYLDRIYYALGNVYLAVPDTAKALACYELGVEKSVQQGIDKALNQIKLGDVYFQQKEFIKAQPNYSESLSQLKKSDEAYSRVSKRSAILDELVVFSEAVHLQDSLLQLSQMPEENRLEVVNRIIAELKKKEEEEKKKQEREDYLSQQEDQRAEKGLNKRNTSSVLPPSEEGVFYFYNQQVVALGKNIFQQTWGRRKLEDDWRRRNKNNPLSDFSDENLASADELEKNSPAEVPEENASEEKTGVLSSDPHDPQFYLQQIPVTEEDIKESNLIIADGLFNMAVIYQEKLEDIPLALETFEMLNTRYPQHENKLSAYYHIYLIYLKDENAAMYSLYKQKIRFEFPESDYAIAMADPNYEYNLRTVYAVQDSLYRDTYQAYLDGNVHKIRDNYQLAATKYNQSKLIPKFSFLNALSYVQTNDADNFKKLLKDIIDKYPDADVSVLASEMMKGFQKGLLLAASGDNMLARGNIFNMRFGNVEEDLQVLDSLEFSPETDTAYELLLIYPQGIINENLLLYTVANFNFGNFVVNDFDLEKTSVEKVGILQIKGFKNFAEIGQYLQMIYDKDGYASELEQSVTIMPISIINYNILMQGKSLEEYMTFFEKHFGKENKNIINRWKLLKNQEFELTANLPETSEELEDLPETEDDSEIEKEIPVKNPVVHPEITIQQDSIQTNIPVTTTNEEQQIAAELENKTEEIINKTSEILENVNTKVDEILNDPVRGIQSLFKRKSSNAIDEYAKAQEKEEKERQKQLKKEKEEKEKELRNLARQKEKEQQELLKKQQEEDKLLLKAKKKQEEELAKLKKQEEKVKTDEKKRIQKERENARKQKEQDRKKAQKLKEKEQKAKEKEREELRKQKEQERKKIQKLKEQERKAKEKERKKK